METTAVSIFWCQKFGMSATVNILACELRFCGSPRCFLFTAPGTAWCVYLTGSLCHWWLSKQRKRAADPISIQPLLFIEESVNRWCVSVMWFGRKGGLEEKRKQKLYLRLQSQALQIGQVNWGWGSTLEAGSAGIHKRRLQLDLNSLQITILINKSIASELEEYIYFLCKRIWCLLTRVAKRAREEETGGLVDARLRVWPSGLLSPGAVFHSVEIHMTKSNGYSVCTL